MESTEKMQTCGFRPKQLPEHAELSRCHAVMKIPFYISESFLPSVILPIINRLCNQPKATL